MASYRTNSTLRSWLRCLWMVSALWFGPVPVGHSHADESGNPEATAALVQHLETFHAGHSNASYHGWHLHWMVRSDVGIGVDGDVGSFPVQSAISYFDVANRDVGAVQQLVFGGEFPEHVLPWCDRYTIREFQFSPRLRGANWYIGAVAAPISVPTLSSVMRC